MVWCSGGNTNLTQRRRRWQPAGHGFRAAQAGSGGAKGRARAKARSCQAGRSGRGSPKHKPIISTRFAAGLSGSSRPGRGEAQSKGKAHTGRIGCRLNFRDLPGAADPLRPCDVSRRKGIQSVCRSNRSGDVGGQDQQPAVVSPGNGDTDGEALTIDHGAAAQVGRGIRVDAQHAWKAGRARRLPGHAWRRGWANLLRAIRSARRRAGRQAEPGRLRSGRVRPISRRQRSDMLSCPELAVH